MSYEELQLALNVYRPALVLDEIISFIGRRNIRTILTWAVGLCAIILWILSYFGGTVGGMIEPLDWAVRHTNIFGGSLLVLIGLWIISLLLESFYYSYFFSHYAEVIREVPDDASVVTFEAAFMLRSGSQDMTKAFLKSRFGRKLLSRLGIPLSAVSDMLSNRAVTVAASILSFQNKKLLKASDIAEALFTHDSDLVAFLTRYKIDKKNFVGAVYWIERIMDSYRTNARWWSRDALGRIPGIGKDWSFGRAFTLEHYGTDASAMPGYLDTKTYAPFIPKNVEELEAVLARFRETNAVIVGVEGSGKEYVVYSLAGHIAEGTVLPPLEHKRVVFLDGNALLAANADKGSFERAFLSIMQESNAAGNIILAINEFPAFISSAAAIGSDVSSIMDPYLQSSNVQFVALASPEGYQRVIDSNEILKERFEKVAIRDNGEDEVMVILEDTVPKLEYQHGVYITYPALRQIVECAGKYFADVAIRDKSMDLLLELIPTVARSGRKLITEVEVSELVEGKTGVAVKSVGVFEREKLLGLEKLLHERIVGQDEAVSAIANALRRARSGINNPDKPLGTFLFLGPTGVGKTETTKALSDIFFGEAHPIQRLDMSEYKTADAMDKLIGSFSSGQLGVLSSMLREQQYGVLLLDEFEKANKEVLDLFLQIFDEGYFSDMSGRRVNARNLIIIATSNAASDVIWEMEKKGESLSEHKNDIIDGMIAKGIFKPELINRFDGVVMFHPLSTENLKIVAKMMLKKLAKRLQEKGITLMIDDTLTNFLVEFGSDPKFGARPIQRAIVEHVEQVIAKKMIKGELEPGATVALSEEELKDTVVV